MIINIGGGDGGRDGGGGRIKFDNGCGTCLFW